MESEPVVTSLILSDSVIVERGTNKVSLIGCFHTLTFPKFPAKHPGWFATLSLTNLAPTGIKLAVTIRVEIEQTGHVLASAGSEINIAVQGATAMPAAVIAEFRKMTIDVPLRLGSMNFQQAAAYSVVVLVNNEQFFQA